MIDSTGVFEIRIDFGRGVRIYFGEEGKDVILLIGGGTKRTQSADIDEAKKLWRAYLESRK